MYSFGLKSTYLKNDDWVPKQLKDIIQIYSNPNKMLKDVLQSTNTDDNTDASETNLNLEYEENEDGSKLGRLFFTVSYKILYSFIYFFFFQKISISR